MKGAEDLDERTCYTLGCRCTVCSEKPQHHQDERRQQAKSDGEIIVSLGLTITVRKEGKEGYMARGNTRRATRASGRGENVTFLPCCR